jgi:hypothetical protein
MKNVKLFLISLLAWLMLAGGVETLFVAFYGVPPRLALAIVVALTLAWAFVVRLINGEERNKAWGGGLVLETVNQVFWANLIVERLFKNNAFLTYARNHDQYVIGGSAVFIPQPGNAPVVIKNNASWPMVAVQRGDSGILYQLNTYITQPTFITVMDLLDISYDKTQSVLKDHFGYLIQSAADDQLINYANAMPAANISYTTGKPTGMLLPGQTGLRNTFGWQDLKARELSFNLANVPADKRVALLSANHYSQFTDSLSESQYRDFSRYYDATTGLVGKMFGFDIMTRSSVLTANANLNAGTLNVNALGQALGATDNEGSLVWQEDSLTRAMGDIKLFTWVDSPLYAGTVNNCFIKMGGQVYRADYAGVGAIMQGVQAGN